MALFKKYQFSLLLSKYGPRLPEVVRLMIEDLLKILLDKDLNLSSMLNNGLNFDENFDGKVVSYTSNAVAGTQDTVAHGMGRVPTNFIVIFNDKAGTVHASAAFDATNVYFTCSAASATLRILLF